MNTNEHNTVLVPINHVATYELVAEQLMRAINLRRFQPGERLPSERVMAEQLAVSRASVREAIRVLETKGMVVVKKGATGGAVVQDTILPDTIVNDEQSLTVLRQSYEFRLAIETNAAFYAAQRRTDDDIVKMKRLLGEMVANIGSPDDSGGASGEHVNKFSRADSSFHIVISQASGVPQFAMAVEQIRSALFVPIGGIYQELREGANSHHKHIVDAIADKDPEGARDAMQAHVTDTYENMRILFEESASAPEASDH